MKLLALSTHGSQPRCQMRHIEFGSQSGRHQAARPLQSGHLTTSPLLSSSSKPARAASSSTPTPGAAATEAGLSMGDAVATPLAVLQTADGATRGQETLKPSLSSLPSSSTGSVNVVPACEALLSAQGFLLPWSLRRMAVDSKASGQTVPSSAPYADQSGRIPAEATMGLVSTASR